MSAYAVLDAYSTQQLGSMVNDAMRKGWRPQGGISAVLCEEQEYVIY
jgi:hypothetical protein